MKKALVTITVGETYISNFRKHCHDLWNSYAHHHNLDILVISDLLDNSTRASMRSPAWQKCLILSQTAVQKYDQVAWIDSDILINPASPSVFEGVPQDKIGAVDVCETPNREDRLMLLSRLYDYWTKTGKEYVSNLTATEYHTKFGLQGSFNSIVQTGVLVMSPKHHRELLEHVYYSYEEKGEPYWNYEMRPLSYEILVNNLEHWINPKFNMMWPMLKQFYYPFLETKGRLYDRIVNKLISLKLLSYHFSLHSKCATTAYLNNYFLHFGGTSNEMPFVNQSASSIYEI